MRFGWLVIGQIRASNPMSSVFGPMHTAKTENTPALSATKILARLPRTLSDTSARRVKRGRGGQAGCLARGSGSGWLHGGRR